jgi:NarL family two-component system response regulator LiaR
MVENRRIRVMLVDDHAVVRSGLSTFLKAFPDLELVAEASSGERAIEICQQTQPDVILMDMMMPGMDGATAIGKILAKSPHIQVIALTSYKQDELVEAALRSGAIGYLLKDITAHELAEAIRSAAAGKPTLSPEAAKVLIKATRAPSERLGSDLTDREREVLGLMVEGLNNNQIAERLVVSISTAKFHVSSILSKLRVSSRTEAMAVAIQNKLV